MHDNQLLKVQVEDLQFTTTYRDLDPDLKALTVPITNLLSFSTAEHRSVYGKVMTIHITALAPMLEDDGSVRQPAAAAATDDAPVSAVECALNYFHPDHRSKQRRSEFDEAEENIRTDW